MVLLVSGSTKLASGGRVVTKKDGVMGEVATDEVFVAAHDSGDKDVRAADDKVESSVHWHGRAAIERTDDSK